MNWWAGHVYHATMREPRAPKVKICGLTRRSDAEHAAAAGADYLGVVLVPDTPRGLSPEAAKEVVSDLHASVVAVLAGPSRRELSRAAELLEPSVVQLHGDESPDEAAEVRGAGPWSVWKAFRVRSVEGLREEIAPYLGCVDGVLLDGWHPDHRGGAGVRFSWEEVVAIRNDLPVELPLIAAGGLTPENVTQAWDYLRPTVVDVSSGVELKPGKKSPELVEAFIEAVRGVARGSEGKIP